MLSVLWICEFILKVVWICDDERSCQVAYDRAFEVRNLESRVRNLAADNQELANRFEALKALAIEYHNLDGHLSPEKLEQYSELIGLEETTGFKDPLHISEKDSKEFLN